MAQLYPSPHARGFRNVTVSLPTPEHKIRFQIAMKRLGGKSHSDTVLKLLEFFEAHAHESDDGEVR